MEYRSGQGPGLCPQPEPLLPEVDQIGLLHFSEILPEDPSVSGPAVSVPHFLLPEAPGMVSRKYRSEDPELPEPQTAARGETIEEPCYLERWPERSASVLPSSIRTSRPLPGCTLIR